MESLVKIRESRHMSQRVLARLAGISYKALQLIEGGSDARLSTFVKISRALSYPKNSLQKHVRDFFSRPPESLHNLSVQMMQNHCHDWEMPFFDFVDTLRRTRSLSLMKETPDFDLDERFLALIAAAVETLCKELQLPKPFWCESAPVLAVPFFVSGVENLKAVALVESPVHFRQRNVFVLENFLKRI